MDLGKPQREYIDEPLEEPIPRQTEREPEPAATPPVEREREEIPA